MESIIFLLSAVQRNDGVIFITFSNIGFKTVFLNSKTKAVCAGTRQIIISEEDLNSPNDYRTIGDELRLDRNQTWLL